MANTMEAVLHSVFLQILCEVTSPLAQDTDGFDWRIRDVCILPEGPCAMLDCEYPDERPGKNRVSTMSLRTDYRGAPGKHFSVTPETCNLGPYTTKSQEAMHTRFASALARQVAR